MKKCTIFVIIFSFLVVCTSCNKEDDVPSVTKSEKGRFDNKPFFWDEIVTNGNIDNLYVGDNPMYSDSGVTTRANVDDFSVLAPSGIYVGAVYPKSSIYDYTFSKEKIEAKNPIDLIFDFRDPYIDEVTRSNGSVGYKLALKRALRSSEYISHSKGDKSSIDYAFSQYYSYSDLQKALNASTSFFSVFKAKIEISKKNLNIKSKLFARLVSSNFTVYMDRPVNGIFQDKSLNNVQQPTRSGNQDNAYIKSITYGKAVYLAIESEYSYEQVKKALEASIKVSFIDASGSASSEITRILARSSLTILAISDNSSDSYFVNGLSNLNTLFKTSYTSMSYGFPVYIQVRLVSTDASCMPAIVDGTTSSTGGGRVPSGGGTTSSTGGGRTSSGGGGERVPSGGGRTSSGGGGERVPSGGGRTSTGTGAGRT